MKKIVKHLQNKIWNKGSALIMAIICMLLIGIITSVVIVTASSNLANINLFKKSTDNFYTAEHVLEELRNWFEDLADDSVRVAYENWLTEYSYNTSGEQHEKFMKLFVKDYKQRLIENFFASYAPAEVNEAGEVVTPAAVSAKAVTDLLTDYAGVNVAWKEEPCFKESSDTEIILNIKLRYTEDDGTESIIDTDLKFSINPEDFKINLVGDMNTEAAKYAVITDGTFTNIQGGTGATVIVKGNVYAGGDATGIGLDFANASGQKVVFNSDKILTRNAFRLSGGANVYVRGENGDLRDEHGNRSYGNIWADNILLDNSKLTSSNKMDAQANVFLADDLTINSKNSEFTLTGPACSFYGYGTSESDVDKSSAIVVNARGSKVHLEQVDPAYGGKISIAGKSFISVPLRFGSNYVSDTFIQGESLSYKGEQAAYLLPSECITGIEHNPMTEEEFGRLTDPLGNIYTTEDLADVTPGAIKCYINISKSALNGGVDLGAYVMQEKPARSVFVNYDDSTRMVYLYLNFRNSNAATDYFNKFAELYPATINKRMESLILDGDEDGIFVNPAALETVGNVSVSTGSGIGQGKALVYEAVKRSNDPVMVEDQWDKSTTFNGLVNNLQDNYFGLGRQMYLTDSVVNMDLENLFDNDLIITNRAVGGQLIYKENPPERFGHHGAYYNYYYLYTGHNITVRDVCYGIIVATGDVKFENGSSFNGLVIARGNVICESGNVQLIADQENITYIMQNYDVVKKVFEMSSIATGTGSGGTIIASDIIKIEYENWKKN